MKTKTNNVMNEDLSALVAKAKTGDQAAFTELYDRTAPELYRCIRAMTRDEDLAWDVQQDSYLQAYQKLNQLESPAAFFPWLRRIAVNITARKMSQQKPLTFTELAGDGEESEAFSELPDLNMDSQPELSLDRKESARLVREILEKLPEEQQLIVGMRYYDELSVREIAQLLKLSTGTVKSQLFHGRKKVETAVRNLERQGVRLYGLSPLPFLLALMRNVEPIQPARQAVVRAIVTETAAGAATEAVAVSASSVTAMTFGQMLHGTVGKLLIGALSVAAIGGGIWAGSKLLKSENPVAPYRPTETAAVALMDHSSTVDPSEDRPEPVISPLPSETESPETEVHSEPASTEAVTTESAETEAHSEPASTEAVTTEPAETEPVPETSAPLFLTDDPLLGEVVHDEGTTARGWQYSYIIPCILADTEGAKAINQDIDEHFGEEYRVEKSGFEDPDSYQLYFKMYYYSTNWNGILSVIVHTDCNWDITVSRVYNYEISTGRWLSTVELLERMNIAADDFVYACKDAFQERDVHELSGERGEAGRPFEPFQEELLLEDGDYYRENASSLRTSNCRIYVYPEDNGQLTIITDIATGAGSGFMECVIPLELYAS